MNAQTTAETLELIKASQQAPDGALAKAWTQGNSATAGIVAYNLEGPAKKLYPVITPLRNELPRAKATGGTQANWKAVTGVNTGRTRIGVSDGNRGGVISTSTADYSAVFREMGLEDYVTFAADLDAQGFDDKKALAVEGLLRSMMIGEEQVILGGNNSLALGTTPTPTLTSAATGGALLGATAHGVGCVALTMEGMLVSAVSGGVVQASTRTNADGSTDTINGGAAQPSAAANVTTAASANISTISASVTAVRGAMGYAWFWGAAAGNLTLGAITTTNSVLITAAAAGTASAPGVAVFGSLTATDTSRIGLHFDGLLTMASTSGLGSYRKVMATGTPGTGTPLTADGTGGVVEIDEALRSFWDNYRLSPDTIWVSAQEMQALGIKILTGGSTSAQRFTFDATQGAIGGGVMVRSYLNKFGMNGPQELKIRMHPNMPAGTMLFTTSQLPYPLSNVGNVMQMLMRRDYYQIEWPQTRRRYEYGVYQDGVLQHYAPFSMGLITNIAAG